MKSISRTTALKIIWSKAKERGWSREELHLMLDGWGITPPRLSLMSTKSMSDVLKCFGLEYFVKEPRDCEYIRRLAAESGRLERLGVICKKMYGKANIQQLNQKQRNGLKAILKNYKEKAKEV